MKNKNEPALAYMVKLGLASYDDICCPYCGTYNVKVKTIQDEPKFLCQNKTCGAQWYKNTGSGTYDSALDHAW